MDYINKSYVICGFARTGSQYLCHILSQLHFLGIPQNYFSQDMYVFWCQKYKIKLNDFSQYFERYLYTIIQNAISREGYFGFKASNYVFFHELWPIISDTARCQKNKLLKDLRQNLQYIYLTRRDTLRQAISITRAQQSNIWFVSKDNDQPQVTGAVQFDYAQICKNKLEIEQRDKEWSAFFKEQNIQPLCITYEDIYPEPLLGVKCILDFLGLPKEFHLNLENIPIKKQQDALTEEWVKQYRLLGT